MTINQASLDKDKLLKELDALRYSDRMKRMALLGRDHGREPGYSALLAALLTSGSAYEGHLALTGASTAKDAPTVQLALQHPKAGVRGRAAGLLPIVMTDPDYSIESEVLTLSAHGRRQLLGSIVIARHQDWAERLLPLVLAQWGASEAASLLPACSEHTVQRTLPELGYALKSWRNLAKRHPVQVTEHMQSVLQNATQQEKVSVWWRFSTAVHILSAGRPAFVLECALAHGPHHLIHPVLRKHLGTLFQASPEGVFKLLIREEARDDLLQHGVPGGILTRNKLLSTKQWGELAALLHNHPMHVAKILDALAPSRRGEVFEAAYGEEGRQRRLFPVALLDGLPHRLREQEAIRMLAIRDIREYRDRTLEITARRSIIHAREELQEAVQVSNADERAAAYTHLIRSTALSRTGMEETLHFLTRVKNDQDPVRGAVMGALSDCPAYMYMEAHVEDLSLLVDSVVEARDTSYDTRASVEKLAFVLLREHASDPGNRLFQFALRTFGRMAVRDGQFMTHALNWDSVPDQALAILFDEVYTLGLEANKRESYNLVLRMANTFGKKGERLPKLQLLLQELVKAKTVSHQAIHHWLAPVETRDERVKALLAKDPSFISFRDVFMHVHLRRQDWLDPYISGKSIKGKYLSGKTIYLVPAEDGFHRWLPRQQKALAALLERVALDANRSFYERASAIRSLTKMPDYASDALSQLLKDKEVHVVEAALHAYSLGEEPEQALPVLLDNLDGDRARVAMYSIPRCVRRMNPDELTTILSTLLNREHLKITVRKETIRLLGTYKSTSSMELLLREYEKPNVHKDVMIAIGHAARRWLEDERSWIILKDMAASQQRDIARSLLDQQPDTLPLKSRPSYVELIAGIASHADGVIGRDALYTLSRWVNGNETQIAACACQAIADLNDTSRWRTALNPLLAACRDGKINEQVIGLCKQLAETVTRAEWEAGAERDLPHRQRLLALLDRLMELPQHTRRLLIPLYRGLINCLEPHATMKRDVINLHLAIIEWNQSEEADAGLEPVIRILHDQPHLLDFVSRQVAAVVRDSQGFWKPEVLLDLVDRMNDRPQWQSHVIGLSLIQVAGEALLWNRASADRLRAYRSHEHEAVRDFAMDTWTVTE
ncbi:HEAT repeat domain-containing protein [Paenibacillus daejeonensis]|uniref:HEAT repeat domain-containing protein n=1 Tax=Paenibacillus daejeonensis TaxID=135193 RepID=UPI0003605216|nr:HEAT repeat domain-containing protein [Paenibacillus daejeonensis]